MAGEADEVNQAPAAPRIVGRYALFDEIASGGMATVHLGRLVGQAGFSRTVAIKRLHPQFAKDPEFVSMFVHEARVASRIQHPNVVTTLDIVALDGEVFLVMEYVHGESLSHLLRCSRALGERMAPAHAAGVMIGVLHGLHAAHEARSERREPLNLVHRDVSPQNVLVGVDGVGRVLDFGVAKAAWRAQSTREGKLKGKIGYMSPEQLNGHDVDRRTDVFAAGVVLWETLTGRRLFDGLDPGEIFGKVLAKEIPEPRSVVSEVSEEMNGVVMRALERELSKRFQSAREFAIALEGVGSVATSRAVGEWVERVAGRRLLRRAEMLAHVESLSMQAMPAEIVERTSQASVKRASFPPEAVEVRSGAHERSDDANAGRASVPSVSAPGRASKPSGVSVISAAAPAVEFTDAEERPSAIASKPVGARRAVVAALIGSLGGGLLAYVVFARQADVPVPREPSARAVDSLHAGTPTAPPQAALAASETTVASAVPEAGARKAPPPASAEPRAVATPPVQLPTPGARRAARSPSPAPSESVPPPAASKSAAPPAPAPADCSPPWTIDRQGIRRVKPECL